MTQYIAIKEENIKDKKGLVKVIKKCPTLFKLRTYVDQRDNWSKKTEVEVNVEEYINITLPLLAGSGIEFITKKQKKNRMDHFESRLQAVENDQKADKIKDLINAGIITINEGRKMMNLPKIKEAYADELGLDRVGN